MFSCDILDITIQGKQCLEAHSTKNKIIVSITLQSDYYFIHLKQGIEIIQLLCYIKVTDDN